MGQNSYEFRYTYCYGQNFHEFCYTSCTVFASISLSLVPCISGTIATVVCLWGWRGARGTTLAGPWAWAVFSLVALTIYALAAAFSDAHAPAAVHLRYLAGLTTLAPFVALLGAKRPQDRAWQLVVASLLGLLAFQDFRTWSLDPTLPPLPHAAWCWLVGGFVGMQFLNYLPTRYAPAACLACWGQVCSLGPCFRIVPGEVRPVWLALPLLSASIVLVALLSRCRSTSGEQRLWTDFRDLYGVLWTLRVAERINAISAEKRLPVRLAWHGFQAANHSTDDINPDDYREASQAMQAILLRFVSQQWQARRESQRADLSE